MSGLLYIWKNNKNKEKKEKKRHECATIISYSHQVLAMAISWTTFTKFQYIV